MREALRDPPKQQAIYRLLDRGCLLAEFIKITPESLAAQFNQPEETMVGYKVTELGRAVAKYGIAELGLLSPELAHILDTVEGEGGP